MSGLNKTHAANDPQQPPAAGEASRETSRTPRTELSRETGTFRAVNLDQGGFVTSDGQPAFSDHETTDADRMAQARDDLPIYEDVDDSGSWIACLARAFFVLAAVAIIIAILIIFMLQSGSAPTLGDSSNLDNLFQ